MKENENVEVVKDENEKKSKELWNKFKRGFKTIGDSTKKAVNSMTLKSKIFFAFSEATSDFEIIGCLDVFKRNKTITGVLNDNIIYFKAVDDFEKDIKVGAKLLDSKNKVEYEIVEIDFDKKVDYYVNVNNCLEPISCYMAKVIKK